MQVHFCFGKSEDRLDMSGLQQVWQESMTGLGSWYSNGKTGVRKLNLSKKNGVLREADCFITDMII